MGKGAHRISVGEGLEEGLSDRVHLMYCDYRNCPGGFMGHRGVGRKVRGGKCGGGSVRQVLGLPRLPRWIHVRKGHGEGPTSHNVTTATAQVCEGMWGRERGDESVGKEVQTLNHGCLPPHPPPFLTALLQVLARLTKWSALR